MRDADPYNDFVIIATIVFISQRLLLIVPPKATEEAVPVVLMWRMRRPRARSVNARAITAVMFAFASLSATADITRNVDSLVADIVYRRHTRIVRHIVTPGR